MTTAELMQVLERIARHRQRVLFASVPLAPGPSLDCGDVAEDAVAEEEAAALGMSRSVAGEVQQLAAALVAAGLLAVSLDLEPGVVRA